MIDSHPILPFQKLTERAVLPTRGSPYAAGLDVYASATVTIPARGFGLVPTGLATAIPVGYYGRIAPRSGLAVKHGIDTLAGVIDSDYRGEIMCALANHSDVDFVINVGDRIAQLVVEAIALPQAQWVSELQPTDRGTGGFGSTGIN